MSLDRRIVFVGPAPGRGNGDVLAGASGRRLAGLAGMDLEDFLARFERRNLLDSHPGKNGKGDAFDPRAARDVADAMRPDLSGRKVVLLGRGVAGAFRLMPDDYEWFKPVEIEPQIEATVMPHPSGISHWWNDKSQVQAAREFMLRIRVGSVSGERRGKERFSRDQMEAALDAARGIPTVAAEILAEATGISCTYQTVKRYMDDYPELEEVGRTHISKILDRATHHVIAGIEAGDPDYVRWLYRTKAAREHILSTSTVNVEGRVDHMHKVDTDTERLLARLTPEQVDVLEGVFQVIDDGAGAAQGDDARGAEARAGEARARALVGQLR